MIPPLRERCSRGANTARSGLDDNQRRMTRRWRTPRTPLGMTTPAKTGKPKRPTRETGGWGTRRDATTPVGRTEQSKPDQT